MWSQVKGQRDYMVISMQCVYKRYLSFLILEMNSSNMDGDGWVTITSKSEKPSSFRNLTKAFYERTLGPVFSLSWKSWWRELLQRVFSLSAERDMRRNSPPPHFWKVIIWGYEILSYCDHEGGLLPRDSRWQMEVVWVSPDIWRCYTNHGTTHLWISEWHGLPWGEPSLPSRTKSQTRRGFVCGWQDRAVDAALVDK